MEEQKTSKQWLSELLSRHYADAARAKAEGGLVAWSTSIAPQELLTAMDICTVYPENHAAAVGARKCAPDLIGHAEGLGYSSDICSYARVNLAYTERPSCEAANIPLPDLIFCCNNICNTVVKWYENIAKKLRVPMILFDLPFNHSCEVSAQNTRYIKEQILEAVCRLEEITGRAFDYDRFREVMRVSAETAAWWKKASLAARAKPSPLNGFELFNYMAAIVCMRGTREGRDLFRLWYEELTERGRQGLGPWKDAEEKYRVLWDGIACWPYLSDTYKILKKNGVNMVTSTYPDSWYIMYEEDDLDGMARAYSSICVNRNLDFAVDNIARIARDFRLDGIIYHSNRSCKFMDFRQFEVQRRVESAAGIPSVIFDGDQTDPRAFSPAQYETRVQALTEMMENNKRKAGTGA